VDDRGVGEEKMGASLYAFIRGAEIDQIIGITFEGERGLALFRT